MALEQDKLGLEVYKVLSAPTYKFNLSMYDADGKSTITPLTAKWVYVKPQDIMFVLPDQDRPSKPEIFMWKHKDLSDDFIVEIIQRLRKLSNQFGVGLTVNDFSHDDTPKALAKAAEQDRVESNIREGLNEGLVGSKKRSYFTLEGAVPTRMVIMHTKSINEEICGARTRNIKDIFIESNGERYRFPTKSIPSARAMTRHLSCGSKWNDVIGSYIQETALDVQAFKKLRTEAKAYNDENLAHKCTKFIKESLASLQRFQGPRGYIKESERVMKSPKVSQKYVSQRATAIKGTSSLQESSNLSLLESMNAFDRFARKDILEDYKNYETFNRVIQEALIDFPDNDVKKLSRALIKGNVNSVEPIKFNPQEVPHDPGVDPRITKLKYLAKCMTPSVDDHNFRTILSELQEKEHLTGGDAKFIGTLYKTLKMNEFHTPMIGTEIQQLIEWSIDLTRNVLGE